MQYVVLKLPCGRVTEYKESTIGALRLENLPSNVQIINLVIFKLA